MNDRSCRPGISTTVSDMGQYDCLFLGFPKMEYQNHCVQRVQRTKNRRKENSIHKQKEKCVCCYSGRLEEYSILRVAFLCHFVVNDCKGKEALL